MLDHRQPVAGLDRVDHRSGTKVPASAMSLAIVIPYRDRPESVRRLVPALAAYLTQRHPGMTAALYVVAQEPGKPFNRGMIANVGFALGQGDGHDQFCFHHVDYLPLDADYSPVPGPTRLIWTGLERPQPYDRMPGDDLDRLRFAMLDAPSWLAPPWGVALRHVRVAI